MTHADLLPVYGKRRRHRSRAIPADVGPPQPVACRFDDSHACELPSAGVELAGAEVADAEDALKDFVLVGVEDAGGGGAGHEALDVVLGDVLGGGLADAEDFYSVGLWQAARAKVLAKRGEGEEAVSLITGATSTADGTSDLDFRGDMHMDFGLVLSRLESPGARMEWEEASRLYTEKGDIVGLRTGESFHCFLSSSQSVPDPKPIQLADTEHLFCQR